MREFISLVRLTLKVNPLELFLEMVPCSTADKVTERLRYFRGARISPAENSEVGTDLDMTLEGLPKANFNNINVSLLAMKRHVGMFFNHMHSCMILAIVKIFSISENRSGFSGMFI